MIVETYRFGNTVVEIDDSSVVGTKEEVDWILEQVALLAREL